MFTGIVEEVGRVRRVTAGGRAGELSIRCARVLEGTKLGDSIAVNGVCLTVTALLPDGFTADVMPETLRRSSLGALRPRDGVNLERAMPADGRFGGHIVSGHIDGLGRITAFRREENAVWITVAASPSLLRLVVEKGSIAIDGVSLTVAAVGEGDFQVSVIPHTAKETVLLDKQTGDPVNLETDIVGKYVARLLGGGAAAATAKGINLDFLAEHGFC